MKAASPTSLCLIALCSVALLVPLGGCGSEAALPIIPTGGQTSAGGAANPTAGTAGSGGVATGGSSVATGGSAGTPTGGSTQAQGGLGNPLGPAGAGGAAGSGGSGGSAGAASGGGGSGGVTSDLAAMVAGPHDGQMLLGPCGSNTADFTLPAR